MAVKIRMKMMGRKHRPFFRICAVDGRRPRDGRVLEELGTYDPMILDTDARVQLNNERIKYWLGVGAQPSENVRVFIKKYGAEGTHVAVQTQARAKLALPKVVPPAPEPAPPKSAEAAAAAAAAAETAATETAEPTAEAVTEEPAAEAAAPEENAAE